MKSWLAAVRERVTWQTGLGAVIVVALLVFGGERALAWQDDRQRVDDEKSAAAAAKAEVEGLIDVSASTSAEDIDKLLDGATAGFREQLEEQADRLRKALTKNRVTATGEVVSVGVVKLEDRRATVIVAAAGTVENDQTDDAEPRHYRLRVDLQKSGDHWLVSGLEFVA
jgi:Mce-associated membrane protein